MDTEYFEVNYDDGLCNTIVIHNSHWQNLDKLEITEFDYRIYGLACVIKLRNPNLGKDCVFLRRIIWFQKFKHPIFEISDARPAIEKFNYVIHRDEISEFTYILEYSSSLTLKKATNYDVLEEYMMLKGVEWNAKHRLDNALNIL